MEKRMKRREMKMKMIKSTWFKLYLWNRSPELCTAGCSTALIDQSALLLSPFVIQLLRVAHADHVNCTSIGNWKFKSRNCILSYHPINSLHHILYLPHHSSLLLLYLHIITTSVHLAFAAEGNWQGDNARVCCALNGARGKLWNLLSADQNRD